MIPHTPKEILDLPAGPELDALVAERVLGIPILGYWTGMRIEGMWIADGEFGVPPSPGPLRLPMVVPLSNDGSCCCRDDPAEHKILLGHAPSCPEPVTSYSTDPVAAWQVVRKMSQGYYWYAHGLVDDGVSFHFVKEDCGECGTGGAAPVTPTVAVSTGTGPRRHRPSPWPSAAPPCRR